MGHKYTRRRAVAAGAALAGTSLAGCLDVLEERDRIVPGEGDGADPDGHPDDGRPDSDDSLAIEHLRLVTERPEGYREYRQVENDTYADDATIWFYFEPAGITAEDAGSDTRRIELTCRLTVSGRDTEHVSDDVTIDREPPEGQLDELYLYLQYTPAEPPPPGRYSAEIVLIDEHSGEQSSERIPFWIEGEEPPDAGAELSIETVTFTAQEPTGYRAYERLDDPVYGGAETIWVYLEPAGIALEERNGEQWYEVEVSARPTGPDGREHRSTRESVSGSLAAGESLEELYVVLGLEIRDPSVGEYTLEIETTDRISRNRASKTITFRIEDRNLELIEIFREVLEEDTDVDIEHLSLRDEDLSLVYRSVHDFEDDAFSEEVAYVAGAYSVLAGEGIDAERLRASGTDASDQEFAYTIETETAAALEEGSISTEEYLDHVYDSLRLRE